MIVVLTVGVYLSLHLPFLAWAPDDIDATNFMLALRHFDVREHQPHPPGYPVFIAMGHVARAAISGVGAVTGPPTLDALDVNALALCSTLAGALSVFPLVALWTAIGSTSRHAWLAAVLAMVSPVFWYTAIRPLSDLPGLATALAAQALLLSPLLHDRQRAALWRLFIGSVLAGVGGGIRTQTLWLTTPALGAVVGVMLWRRDARAVGLVVVGFAAGVLAWLVPLMMLMGGWRHYIDVLTAQAADDLRGAIFAVDLSPRTLMFGLIDTFVLPWGKPTIAALVLALAAWGSLRLLHTRPREVAVLSLLFMPYLALHLLFHETSHIRYALPLVPPVAYLTLCGLQPLTRSRLVLSTAAMLVAAWAAMGPVAAQARQGSPAVQALADLRDAARTAAIRPVIAMHHAVRQQLRFADLEQVLLRGPVRYEWLSVVDYFRAGGLAPVWFLANQRRSDLVLFDPAAKRRVRDYNWQFSTEAVLGGARPRAVTWYEIQQPGWMAAEGWALTPETRGVANRAHRSPQTGAVAYIARRSAPAVLMIGGRNLGGPCRTAARLELTIDGRRITDWQLPAGEPFLHFLDLPAGRLEGTSPYAELRLLATDLSGAGLGVDVSLEQFDVQSGVRPVAGLALGWHEPELETTTGTHWRWTSQRAIVQVRNFGRSVMLNLKADDPVRVLGRSIELQVRAAGRVLAQRRFDSGVEWTVPIPARVLEASGGRFTLMTDTSFVPDERDGNGDRRDLALRVFDLDVQFDSGTSAGR